jgi:hypothetical protein
MMLNKVTALFQKPDPQLADFLAPLPLDECVQRLAHRDGKFYDLETTVQIDEVDENHYTYQMRIQRHGKEAFDHRIFGSLSRQDDSTTRVLLMREYRPSGYEILRILGIFVWFGVFVGLIVSHFLGFLLMVVIGVAVGFYADRLPSKYNAEVQMIQETLDARPPNEKAKNEA